MSRNQRIIAAVLVFAALGYLIAYTIVTHPYVASDRSADSPDNANTNPAVQAEQSTQTLAETGTATADSATPAQRDTQQRVASEAAIPDPIRQDDLAHSASTEVENTIAVLSDPDRLHGAMAQSLMAEREFDDLIRGLEKSSSEAYAREARLLDDINRMDPVLDNRLRLRVLNCNDAFCGLAFNNDSEDAVLEFVGALMATSEESGAMAIQPLVVDDIPQLRVIIHRSASYQVN